jgi:hypothetical protein
MLYKRLLLLLLLLIPNAAILFAQNSITGVVRDAHKKGLSSATISLKDAEGKILSYGRSDVKGYFVLNLSSANKAALLEVNMLGYKKQAVPFLGKTLQFEFTMQESAIDLPTVVIKNRPALIVKGDTLSYRLSDYSGREDRVLGDVLKKMPGIEVSPTGKISYNGKNISSFYIDGDNLLDDKYNIATKSIPKDAVDKVQVIENDQPVKMLRNKMRSDDVALNITIKDEAKLKVMGQANLGAGFPSKFDGQLNAMLLNKKYKGINYIKANNIGVDPAQDLVSHNFADYVRAADLNKTQPLLSVGAAGVPDLPQNRYLFNRAGLLNINNLVNLKKDVQLKTNLYYLKDRQRMDYDKFTEYLLPDGNVQFSESQRNISSPDQLHAQTNVKFNRDKSYLNNTLILQHRPNQFNTDLTANGIYLNQQLDQKTTDLTNEFSYMNTLGSGNVYEVHSFLNYSNLPEHLNISPGLNDSLFNNGIPYAGLSQSTTIPSYVLNNYFSFKVVSTRIMQTYKMGIDLQRQHLRSSLSVLQNDQSESGLMENSINNLQWNQSKGYVVGAYDYETTNERFKATLTVPVRYQYIHYLDAGYSLNKQLNKFFVNPQLNLKYKTGIENFFLFTYELKNELGTIDDVYKGAILKNYRSLYSNDAPVSERKTNSANIFFNYRKAITLLFFSIQGTYNQIQLNTISSSILTNNLQQRVVLPFENTIKTYIINGNMSKYLFIWRTTVSAGLNFSQNTSNQILNNELLPYKTATSTAKFGIQAKVTDYIGFNYSLNGQQTISKSVQEITTGVRFRQIRQQAQISLNVLNDVFINASAEHLYTSQSGLANLSYLFSDLSLRYKEKTIHVDFEIGMNNLANVTTYKTVFVSANAFTSGSYRIPGRMAVFKATFNF